METVGTAVEDAPAAGDRAALSKSRRTTLEALYQHPITHNLEWSDVVALFAKLGAADQKPNNEIAFRVGAEHRLVRKPHAKDLTADEVMEFRHMLSRAGWSPHAASEADSDPDTAPPDLLVVVEHHEARLYQLDIRSSDQSSHVIKPYDPHRFLHHLSHKDQSRERGQRAPEDPSFYERIAQAVAAARRIVVVGHGKGHSNAAHHLIASLHSHHGETGQKVVCEIVADLSSLTEPQLLDLGRRALTA